MGIDRTGSFLEGVRYADSNGGFTYPPRTLVTNGSEFSSISRRSEYLLFVSGQSSNESGIDIGNPNLRIEWTKNNGTINRFDWDGFNRRWSPSPGSSPEPLGTISNNPRIIAPILDSSISSSESPYYLYIGYPTRAVTFNIILVQNSTFFSSVSSGYVQQSLENGELNFSDSDILNSSYASQTLYVSRQSFYDRTKSNGKFGELPSSSSLDYDLFISPIPGSGQTPRIRIGYNSYLNAQSVSNESQLYIPSQGSVIYSQDTGKVVFSSTDINNYPSYPVYYDGITYGSIQLTTTNVGSLLNFWPSSIGSVPETIGWSDSKRFNFYITLSSGRYYFETIFSSSTPSSEPDVGTVVVNTTNGNVYISETDSYLLDSGRLFCVDGLIYIEDGVSFQLYRSGANTSGLSSANDFVESYFVARQIAVNGIQQSPFVILPVIPIESSLSVSVEQGTSGGTFTGSMPSLKDPTTSGIGYISDFDTKQLKFAKRSTTSYDLQRSTSSIKINEVPMSQFGFELYINDILASSSDYTVDFNTGLLEFTESIGVGTSKDKIGISGAIVSSSSLTASSSVFESTDVSSYILIKTGSYIGFYQIQYVLNSTTVYLYGSPFQSNESITFDVRSNREIICDRIWNEVFPEIRSLSIQKGYSALGPFTTLERSEYSVIPSIGQISLSSPSLPDEIYKISYVSQDSEDNGVTYTENQRVEFAGFKVRHELCTYSQNSGDISFNPNNKTVVTDRPFTIYVDGITVTEYQYKDINTISLGIPLTTQEVYIDYWIAESPGGISVFNTSYSPIVYDTPSITAGSSTLALNGSFSYISEGGLILIDDTNVFIIDSFSYDSVNDITTITFTYPFTSDSDGNNIKYSDPVESILTTEFNPVDSVGPNSNFITISGLEVYEAGTLITLNDDAYIVLNSQQDNGKTKIYIVGQTKQSYVLPYMKRSLRPIYYSSTSFYTDNFAILSRDHVLVKSGNNAKVLVKGIDYDIADGGKIELYEAITYGSELSICYVSRKDLDSGTSISVNSAYFISPSTGNGLLGQKLILSYDLLSPDSFFYRVETFDTFFPELLQELNSSSSTGSGPNIGDSSSLSNKDRGKPSLYFDEQHYDNFDELSSRLVYFYNEVINDYEDILSNLDGRVVGGENGRFRYDGNRSGTQRSSYASIRNDIDDKVKLYDSIILTSLNPITFSEGPVYGSLWDYNSLSRIFPLSSFATVAINDKVSTPVDFGKVLGTFNISPLTSVDNFRSSQSRASYYAIDSDLVTIISKDENGDVDGLSPSFFVGQKVTFLSDSGQSSATVLDVVSINSSPFRITLSGTPPYSSGSIIADVSDSSYPNVHNYQIGRHVTVDFETGQIKNSQLPPPAGPDETLVGNELLDSSINFSNTEIVPKRIPALDGSKYNDFGYKSRPQLTYTNEIDLLEREKISYNYFGTGIVSSLNTVTSSTVTVASGQLVYFISGLNSGSYYTVNTVGPAIGQFTVSPNFDFIDLVARDMMIVSPSGNIFSILGDEIEVINTNTEIDPVYTLGVLNSQVISCENCARDSSYELASGVAIVDPNLITMTDSSVNFSSIISEVDGSYLILVDSGPNQGIYGVASVSGNSLDVISAEPFGPFSSGVSINYTLYKLESMIPNDSIGLLSSIVRKGLNFASITGSWTSSISNSGIALRLTDILERQSEINDFIPSIESIVGKSGKLYDGRFLWISQRTDKKNGFLTKTTRAIKDRQDAEVKIVEDQKKLLSIQDL